MGGWVGVEDWREASCLPEIGPQTKRAEGFGLVMEAFVMGVDGGGRGALCVTLEGHSLSSAGWRMTRESA